MYIMPLNNVDKMKLRNFFPTMYTYREIFDLEKLQINFVKVLRYFAISSRKAFKVVEYYFIVILIYCYYYRMCHK